MIKKTLAFGLTLICCLASGYAQNVLKAKSADISFYSKTPLEDIDAVNKSVASILNTKTNDIVFLAPNRSFKFKRDLMETHFNENYMESDKFASSSYSGKINEAIDWTKDGTYNVSTTGKLKIHGVEKTVTETGVLKISGATITLSAKSKIKVADYGIEIPSVVSANIAETVDVSIDAVYSLK